jgi:3',5'-cyclic AMP phosphodiesterase CpdA
LIRRIAHLSDIHILDARAAATLASYRFATRFLSAGRSVDPALRRRRLCRALALAKASGAQHFVISGDLTEVGAGAEFEQFAEVLHEARLPAESVTLVPGNHDAYTHADAWRKALDGPLARFRTGSAATAGKVVDRGAVAILPVDTTCFQSIASSRGVFTRGMVEAVERRAKDPAFREKALVLVTHHPPFHPHALPIVRWMDGLRGAAEVLELFARQPRLQLLHGHLHRVFDRILATRAARLRLIAKTDADATPTRAFGAPATCDGPDDAPNVRVYDVRDGALHAASIHAA